MKPPNSTVERTLDSVAALLSQADACVKRRTPKRWTALKLSRWLDGQYPFGYNHPCSLFAKQKNSSNGLMR